MWTPQNKCEKPNHSYLPCCLGPEGVCAFTGDFLWRHTLPTKGTAPEAEAQGASDLSSHLQLFLIKVAQPLQGGHLVEAIQEGFCLLFHAPGETPVGQQPTTEHQPSVELRRTAQLPLGACQKAAVAWRKDSAER